MKISKIILVPAGLIFILVSTFLIFRFSPEANKETAPMAEGRDITSENTPKMTNTTAEPSAASSPGPEIDAPTDQNRPQRPPSRAQIVRTQVEALYGQALAGLNLSPNELATVKHYLIERMMVAYDANEALAAIRTENPPEFPRAIKNAQQEVEAELRAAVGDSIFAKVKLLIEASQYLAQVNQTYSRLMTESGAPLMPQQIYELTELLYKVNESSRDDTQAHEISPSGLSRSDELVINNAAKFLNPSQVNALQQAIITRNKMIRRP